MSKAKKVAEAPVEEVKPEATVDEPIIDNRRSQIENQVIADNRGGDSGEPVVDLSQPPKAEVAEEVKPLKEDEGKGEEENSETQPEDDITKIKKSVQKRIDKVVAQKKSVEEELERLRAEVEDLKSSPKQPTEKKSEDVSPEEIEAYIAKMQEEGNHKEAAAAIRFLVKTEKELAMKEVAETQNKTQKEATQAKSKVDADLAALANDYMVYDEEGQPDPESELTLSNKKGMLFKTAMSLYNDVELHRDFYNDTNVAQGFRRAVADAYREIHQKGLIKTPKGNEIIPDRVDLRKSLGDPSSGGSESSTPSTNSANLSDAEKVRDEIKARNKNRLNRTAS